MPLPTILGTRGSQKYLMGKGLMGKGADYMPKDCAYDNWSLGEPHPWARRIFWRLSRSRVQRKNSARISEKSWQIIFHPCKQWGCCRQSSKRRWRGAFILDRSWSFSLVSLGLAYMPQFPSLRQNNRALWARPGAGLSFFRSNLVSHHWPWLRNSEFCNRGWATV